MAPMTTERPTTETTHWLAEAARQLEDLGFELEEPDRSSGDSTSHLVVALRPKPTLRHFDPEEVDYWATEGGRGRPATLDREARLPLDTGYAWGVISVVDRLGVSNQFLSFGGELRAQMLPDATILADFGSPAPILRVSGHSQTIDPLAAEAGAFFGRIKVPIDFVPGIETVIAQTPPRALYCAFAQTVREKMASRRRLREANRWLVDWSGRETQYLQAEAPDDWKAGAELRRRLAAASAG
jgi:hypothetical protein